MTSGAIIPRPNTHDYPHRGEQSSNIINSEACKDLSKAQQRDSKKAKLLRSQARYDPGVYDSEEGDTSHSQAADKAQSRGLRDTRVDESSLDDAPAVRRADEPPRDYGAAKHGDPAVTSVGHCSFVRSSCCIRICGSSGRGIFEVIASGLSGRQTEPPASFAQFELVGRHGSVPSLT